ncbi:MAG: hypothetical protein KAI72_04830 [Candidatus Pacebacteria bacterium]|nr:hypothetical protein [Candidatus Paceibacterota bacterium]
MNKAFLMRAIYDIAVLVSILSVNWWITLILCFGGVILFRSYYECIFAGIALDMLYGIPQEFLMNTSLIFTAITSVLFIASGGLKTKVRYE